uniref:Uncharacterized protein n=1 Tax=Paramoeba aestuarina TaxID=180227 RepID=A0A7S4NWP6_9EUKA
MYLTFFGIFLKTIQLKSSEGWFAITKQILERRKRREGREGRRDNERKRERGERKKKKGGLFGITSKNLVFLNTSSEQTTILPSLQANLSHDLTVSPFDEVFIGDVSDSPTLLKYKLK